ncbi:hypothetical protein KDD93_00775 [Campylobacter sp. faydin G-24]|uniref:Response regulatory domain-containing protein n=1 Tax=Campylobacter anatolicus TaxID=2829105 RepID=A0ABS5HHP3_9BACT|nr:hypothetical protein [Campylobacter anatolicus]MBR8463107.1 hypothetical protein [Campylobacter anatolicus]
MKWINDYKLLVSIVAAIILCSLITYDLLDEAINLRQLNNAIDKQLKLKDVMKALSSEREASLEYIKDSSEQNTLNLKIKQELTDKAISNMLSNLEYTSTSTNELISSINYVRKNILEEQLKFLSIFFSLYDRINNSIVENYVYYKGRKIDNQTKLYLSVLLNLYDMLDKTNSARSYLVSVLQNDAKLNKDSIRRKLLLLNFSPFRTFLLPNIELRRQINETINLPKNLEIFRNIDILRSKFIALESYEITKDDITKLDMLEREKFLLLLDISNTIENKLVKETTYTYSKVHSEFIIAFIIALALILAIFKLKEKLLILDNIKKSIIRIKDIPETKIQIDPSKTLENFIISYENLNDEFKKADLFNKIKSEYLMNLSKSQEKKYKNNIQSLEFLRKTCISSEQMRAINIIEENSNISYLVFENIKNILNIENTDLSLNITNFNPQTLFASVLESKMNEVTQKQINYITFIDPKLNTWLEGDESKIMTIVSNLLSIAISECNPYSNVIVTIKTLANQLSNDIVNLNISVTSETNPINKENMNESMTFWLKSINMFLKMMDSKLSINNIQNTRNKFNFILKLKSKNRLEIFNHDKDLKIGLINDHNSEYNKFFAQILDDFEIDYEMIPNVKTATNLDKYDIIFIRESKNIPSDIKNLVTIKDPLTPINVSQNLLKKFVVKSLQKFTLTRPQILVYEPNSVVLKMIEYAFKPYNVDLTLKNNYDEFINSGKHSFFDLIFIDTQNFSGGISEFVTRYNNVKAINQNSTAPIIGMTSNTSELSKDEIISNFDGYIKKPFNAAILREILQKFIPNIYNFIKKEAMFNKNNKILLCKKNSVENKIFAAALSDFKENLTTANDLFDLINKIENTPFGIILIDANTLGFDAQSLIDAVENLRKNFDVDTQIFVFNDKPIKELSTKPYIKILSTHISKVQLAEVIKRELNGGGYEL